MTRHVLLFTDRPEVDALWTSACALHGLEVSVRTPAEFGDAVESVVTESTATGSSDAFISTSGGISSSGTITSAGHLAAGLAPVRGAAEPNGHGRAANGMGGASVVLDAASDVFDEDELLASLGIARAVGAVVAVARADDESRDDLDELLEELCPGLVARSVSDVDRVVSVIARRLDTERRERFEFVTVSPDGANVLTILGDGCSKLTRRPISAEDDGGTVVAIDLSEDAKSAKIELESGIRLRISARDFTSANGGRGGPGYGRADLDAHRVVDGQRLGKRLRALRKEAGLTQAELARRTGIHRPNIARVEAGRHTPSLETLSRLANAIGVSTTRVLAEE